jgi:hypothetical protein
MRNIIRIIEVRYVCAPHSAVERIPDVSLLRCPAMPSKVENQEAPLWRYRDRPRR